MPRKGSVGAARQAMARVDRHQTYATSITQSRLLDLIKYGRESQAMFTAGTAARTVTALAYQCWFPYRAAQLWQLTQFTHAVVWIDGGNEGVSLFTEYSHALDSYTRTCRALAKMPELANHGSRKKD